MPFEFCKIFHLCFGKDTPPPPTTTNNKQQLWTLWAMKKASESPREPATSAQLILLLHTDF